MTNDPPGEWRPDPDAVAAELAEVLLTEARTSLDAVDRAAAVAASIDGDESAHVLAGEVRDAVDRLAQHLVSQEEHVTLVGHVQERPHPPEGAECRVQGCGSPATRFATAGSGDRIAVCSRCGEELDAISA